jgi:hypothetical protein
VTYSVSIYPSLRAERDQRVQQLPTAWAAGVYLAQGQGIFLHSTASRSNLGSTHYATNRKVAGSRPDEVDFYNLTNPSGRTMALGVGSASNRVPGILKKKPGGKGRPARRADNLAAIC